MSAQCYVYSQKNNNFLWVCWFLAKNLANFVSISWKLDSPKCHNLLGKKSHNLGCVISLLQNTFFIWTPQRSLGMANITLLTKCLALLKVNYFHSVPSFKQNIWRPWTIVNYNWLEYCFVWKHYLRLKPNSIHSIHLKIFLGNNQHFLTVSKCSFKASYELSQMFCFEYAVF